MTTSRDPDRLVRAWLDLMPSETPDRVIDAVLQAVETAPQARRPIGAALRRPFQVTRYASAALAVAIVAVLAGGAVVLTRFGAPRAGGPPPTLGLPQLLQGTWLGSPRTIGGAASVSGIALHVGAGSISVGPSNEVSYSFMSVTASIDGTKLRIETGQSPAGCQPGQVGTYDYYLSGSGQTLTITADQEPCPQRTLVFAGTWWLSDCITQDSEVCLGRIDEGPNYGSQFFASIGAPGVPWVARYGALTFDVPPGWANDADWPSVFSLAPADDFTATPLHGDPADDISVYSNVIPESQATPCSGQPDPRGEVNAMDYVAWLRTVKGLAVGPTSTIRVDGVEAPEVDVTVPTAPTALCGGTDPVIEYLLSAGWYLDATHSTGTTTHAIGAGNHDRLILLNMPEGYLTAIVITTHAGTKFEAFAQQAMPIVASFRFRDAFPTP